MALTQRIQDVLKKQIDNEGKEDSIGAKAEVLFMQYGLAFFEQQKIRLIPELEERKKVSKDSWKHPYLDKI